MIEAGPPNGAESGQAPLQGNVLELTVAEEPITEPADEMLMLAYRAGDASAFDRLYARHRGSLYRFLLRGCSNRAQAEDMFQDVWFNVIRAREGYEPTARFSTWLFRIAHNRLVDGYRQARPTAELDEELADTTAGPEQRALQRDQSARLLRAIAALPLEQRTALLLHEERGFSLEDIANISGVGRETVKSRLRYALQKLKGTLTDDG